MAFRRFFEETAWRIKAVKLERDRHANQRHLNPLNVGDLFTAMVESMKGRNQDAILVLGEVRLHRHCARPCANCVPCWDILPCSISSQHGLTSIINYFQPHHWPVIMTVPGTSSLHLILH